MLSCVEGSVWRKNLLQTAMVVQATPLTKLFSAYEMVRCGVSVWVHFKVLSRYQWIQFCFHWNKNQFLSWVPAGQNIWGRGWGREVFMFTRLTYISERLKRKKTVLKSVPEQTRSSGNKLGEIQVLCTWKKVGCNIPHMLKTWKLGRPEKREL